MARLYRPGGFSDGFARGAGGSVGRTMKKLLLAVLPLALAPALPRRRPRSRCPPRRRAARERPRVSRARGHVRRPVRRRLQGRVDERLYPRPDPAPGGVDVRVRPEARTFAPFGGCPQGAVRRRGQRGQARPRALRTPLRRPDQYAAVKASIADGPRTPTASSATARLRRAATAASASFTIPPRPDYDNVVIGPVAGFQPRVDVNRRRRAGYNRTDRKYRCSSTRTSTAASAPSSTTTRRPTTRTTAGELLVRGRRLLERDDGRARAHAATSRRRATVRPNTSLGGHCVDERDRMCYSDRPASSRRWQLPCALEQKDLFRLQQGRLLQHRPPANSYLDLNWNTATAATSLDRHVRQHDRRARRASRAPSTATRPPGTSTSTTFGSRVSVSRASVRVGPDARAAAEAVLAGSSSCRVRARRPSTSRS